MGSVVSSTVTTGQTEVDVSRQIAQASKAFGALRKSVFMDKSLQIASKQKVYHA